jgi:hypothetical protein
MYLKDPKESGVIFLLPLFLPLFSGSYLALVERIRINKTALLDSEIVIRRAGLLLHYIVISCSWLLFLHRAAADFSFEWRNYTISSILSRVFSPFCAELASRCRRSFGELSPGGANDRVIAS